MPHTMWKEVFKMKRLLRAIQLTTVLAICLLLVASVAPSPSTLSREHWDFTAEEPPYVFYLTIWPERPWLDVLRLVKDDEAVKVIRLQRMRVNSKEGSIEILDVALGAPVIVVSATSGSAWLNVYQATGTMYFTPALPKMPDKRVIHALMS